MKLNSYTVAMLGLGLVSVLGCSSGPAEENAEATATEGSELRALRAGEVVGSIAYGQTRNVGYAPYFRALMLDVRVGDVIDATVMAPNASGKPMLWLTRSAGQTTNLAADLNAAGATSARIKFTALNTGTYYLVFRDTRLAKQTLRVSLAARTTAPCDPDEENCDGSVGERCTANAQCAANLICSAGRCAKRSDGGGGSLGDACTTSSQCSGSLICTAGKCASGGGGGGSLGDACTTSSQCSGSLVCTAGKCASSGGGGGSLGSVCASDAQCAGNLVCPAGRCIATVGRGQSCVEGASGADNCSGGLSCMHGTCRKLGQQPGASCDEPIECDPATTWGCKSNGTCSSAACSWTGGGCSSDNECCSFSGTCDLSAGGGRGTCKP